MTTQTFPLTGAINLFVRIGHGTVSVEARDDLTEATVDIDAGDGVEAKDVPIAAEMRGPTLHVAGPREGALFDLGLFGGRPRSTVHVRVVVPTLTAVKIVTVDAPVRVVGRVNGADVAFGRGEAEFDTVDGDLRLRFGQGKARAQHVGGAVQVRSGHGSVDLGEVGGDVRYGSGTGDLHVAVARKAVLVRSGSGAARLDEVHGDVDLTSGAGDLRIGLPTGVNARLDAHTGTGHVRSDLPIDGAPGAGADPISLRVRTAHGNVHIVRAA
ncbi:DUF4097 domain-containing protein [uncultured Jatrophihabitans sp.]|uniref:DUF4097 family beta strand repeat-containing protein n=1 Tax=uncultured Jatrophihabitans sp. TaxID=1610747 RepID=UPI0035CBCF0E